jgi:2-(1,2-epoxy-1,2-dihydrophenyl)acetyl-CoA isomerase
MTGLLEVVVEGGVAVVTIRRPASMNALGEDGDGAAFSQMASGLNARADVRAVILTGEGRAFSAGGNVKAMQARSGAFAGGPDQIRNAYRDNIHRIVRSVWGLEMPVIAAVNGPAIGLGCDLACMADTRIASTDARFGVTFLKLGLIPGDGGAWLLPRIIGISRASELLFTGDVVDAETAANWGLVSRVVPPEALMREAHALAHRIAAQPPRAVRLAKTLLRAGQTAGFETVMEMSAAAQGLMHHTLDHAEAVDALLAKRQGHYTGD